MTTEPQTASVSAQVDAQLRRLAEKEATRRGCDVTELPYGWGQNPAPTAETSMGQQSSDAERLTEAAIDAIRSRITVSRFFDVWTVTSDDLSTDVVHYAQFKINDVVNAETEANAFAERVRNALVKIGAE